ncbi:hypothetical protein G7Y31_05910 [Corynebacterium lizhenjunii]|uniref:Uncharacterized protein n=1 Tax=Corynebacterium lizhenjunii TaxID=2709394 RepID=A0A7T0KGW9_9CORY|nr:hypothetical protein [Corynebacterium lizhenjunii]QPK80201.1 hypothetical protein G7Y31_05910 [Corynebacterium lizhenjunii]
MSIRTTFQPNVDEFITDLTSFATGSYLRPEEKEWWDQPFDPKVLPQLRAILEGFLDQLDGIAAGNSDAQELDAAAAVQLFTKFTADVEAFNARHAYAVVEPEEKAELESLVHSALRTAGATEETLASLPEFE